MPHHRRSGFALFCLVVLSVACSESPRDAVGALGTQTFAPSNLESGYFTVYGGTYGPQGQFVTPPSCSPAGPDMVTDTVGWLQPPGQPPIPITFTHPTHLGIDNTTGDDCPTFRDAGGNLYVGGSIYANVTGAGPGVHLEMPAKFTNTAEVSVPIGATAELGVVVSDGYRFVDWLITRADFSQYRTTTQTLYITAETADRVYFAELQVITDQGNPPPNDTTSTCIDPTQPSCDP